MSGHSKWATIKRQKGANDAKRGAIFTKLSKAITIAVQQGGGVTDPNGNFRLRLAIDAARASNMPKDNIERAIQRASGAAADEVVEVVYEGFGPGGFSVIVDAITDNKQRTTPIVKSTFEKNGGSMGTPGAVSYQYQQKGSITVPKDGKGIDELFLLAADVGAEDVEEAGEEVIIYTKPDELAKVREGLASQGLQIADAQLTRKPTVTVQITDKESVQKALSFIEKLEELDDVQNVYANFDIPEALLSQ
jgi:YebC/PmpR family DNA-binding regulatory protein